TNAGRSDLGVRLPGEGVERFAQAHSDVPVHLLQAAAERSDAGPVPDHVPGAGAGPGEGQAGPAGAAAAADQGAGDDLRARGRARRARTARDGPVAVVARTSAGAAGAADPCGRWLSVVALPEPGCRPPGPHPPKPGGPAGAERAPGTGPSRSRPARLSG